MRIHFLLWSDQANGLYREVWYLLSEKILAQIIKLQPSLLTEARLMLAEWSNSRKSENFTCNNASLVPLNATALAKKKYMEDRMLPFKEFQTNHMLCKERRRKGDEANGSRHYK